MNLFSLVVCFLYYLFHLSCSIVASEIIDPSDWNYNRETKDLNSAMDSGELVDPLGWNYNRETKSLKRAKHEKHLPDQCDQLLKSCHGEVQSYCEGKQINIVCEASNPLKTMPACPSVLNCDSEMKFVKRFINLLLTNAHISSSSLAESVFASGLVDIRVTEEDLKVLMSFGDPEQDISLRQLDTVMSRVINSGLHMSKEYFTWMDNLFYFLSLKEVWLFAGMSCIVIFVLWLILSGHTVTGTLMIFFVVIFVTSYGFEFYRLLKEAEVEQMAYLKMHSEIPLVCRPHEMGLFESVWHYVLGNTQFKVDDCQKYYSTVMIDPMAKVSPTRVLSNVAADLILGPAGKVGEAVAAFTSGVMGNLPFYFGIPVLMFSGFGSFFLVFVALLTIFGGRIRLSSLLFGVEVGSTQVKDSSIPLLSSASRQDIKNETSDPPMIDAFKSSSSNLVLMDVSSLQRLISQSSQNGSETEDFNNLQHRKPIESIQSPGPSIPKENNQVSDMNIDSVSQKPSPKSMSPHHERQEQNSLIAEDLSNHELEEPSKVPVTKLVSDIDRTAEHHICSGGGDASSGK